MPGLRRAFGSWSLLLVSLTTFGAEATPPKAVGPSVKVSYRLDRIGVRSYLRLGLSGIMDAQTPGSPRVHIDAVAGRLVASFPDHQPTLSSLPLGRTRLRELRTALRRDLRTRGERSSDLLELLAFTDGLLEGPRSGPVPVANGRHFQLGPIWSTQNGRLLVNGGWLDGFRVWGILGRVPVEVDITIPDVDAPKAWTATIRRWGATDEVRPLTAAERRDLVRALGAAANPGDSDGHRYRMAVSELTGE